MMNSRRGYRLVFATVLLLSLIFLVGANVSAAGEHPYTEFREQSRLSVDDRDRMAPARNGITVVTSHLEGGHLVALHPDGTLLYHDERHDGYWDVDPSPAGRETVLYTATDEIHDESDCRPVDREKYCIRQVIERANLTTGEVTVLYSQINPRYHASEWHDVDRVNESHYVVADMYSDEVFIVNVSSGIVVWEWSAQNYRPLTTGGSFPADWTHLNDVEVLDDGRLVVSLRNHDQVVFIDRQQGVVDEWTLGADDQHDVLHEQHNPDYIPPPDGGPAVVLADSERNRIVEYQRTDAGEWDRSWVWQDERLQWPRDADRLPNGHTLITDTHGGRVFEIDPQGDIVWTMDIAVPYEAERLHTGDESTGGPSALDAELVSRSGGRESEVEHQSGFIGLKNGIKGLFPNKVRNAVAYVTPTWVGFADLAVLLIGGVTAITWGTFELAWADFRLRSPVVRE